MTASRARLQLIAAENQCSRRPGRAGLGRHNKTTEGFVGARFHGGCEVVDCLETLAASRAREAFGAKYANVQPHSGTSANQIVLTAVLDKGDRILSLAMDQGGHVSHGAPVALAGRIFEIESYRVRPDNFLLDYDAIRQQALRFRPKLIICGTTATPGSSISPFRAIADEVGAYLMADVSHISGLISAGVHRPTWTKPIHDDQHLQAGGPRGGLIPGRDFVRPFRWATGPSAVGADRKDHVPGFQARPI
jgi:glycine hydroxymethyltransferase